MKMKRIENYSNYRNVLSIYSCINIWSRYHLKLFTCIEKKTIFDNFQMFLFVLMMLKWGHTVICRT